MNMSINSEEFQPLFENTFIREIDILVQPPSVHYFWYRKRLQLQDLIEKNTYRFCDSSEEAIPKFIDLGCGKGGDLAFIAKIFEHKGLNYNFLGLEGDPESLSVCQLRKKYTNLETLNFLPVNIEEELPLPDNSVDIAYSSEVIEHLLYPEDFLLKVKRTLKPNGYLILTTPNEPNVF